MTLWNAPLLLDSFLCFSQCSSLGSLFLHPPSSWECLPFGVGPLRSYPPTESSFLHVDDSQIICSSPKHLPTARFHRLQPCYLPFKPTPQPPIISFPSFVFPTASSQQTSPWPASTAQQTPDNPCLFKSEVTESRLPCRQISYPSLCEQMRRDGKPGKQPQQDSKVTAQRRSGSLSPPITQLKTATRPSHVMSAPYQPMQGARASFLAPCCAPCTLLPWLSPPGFPPLPHRCSSRAACKWSPSSVPSPFPTPTFPDFSWDPRLTFPSFQSTVSLEITDCRPRFHSFREPVMPPCPRNS